MLKIHYEKYFSESFNLLIFQEKSNDILTGELISKCQKKSKFLIKNGIPRFVSGSNYASNFGLQWNKYKSTQLDSFSGLSLTANRFWKNTKWDQTGLAGKTVLEVGAGAGRFTEILLQSGASVVSFDYSDAVDACYDNNQGKGDLFLFQGDVYDIPFPDSYFDYVFCYGVLQHTPYPEAAYKAIFSKLKNGGKISIDYYRKMDRPTPWSTPKYFWRPVTAKMNPGKLLKIIHFYIPLYLPIDTVIKKIPKIGERLSALIPIPCWNYLDIGLSKKQRLEWAIMDTFDALGARFDTPKTLEEVKEMVSLEGSCAVDVFYGSNGIVANSSKIVISN
ncbi:class I SAM-dependent methyltransferase [Desulfonatronum thiodismutans]|uniref:class I SAM-dependent methyltransferase n=1 Tax=Desulfonatronum thiodismutans TaxID=159290 RepID=UPI000A05E23C|nr:class I SAM-dependent methyltransferase [Desulfonatronum thiodismutans]